MFQYILTILFLVLFSPIMIIICLAIYFLDGPPIFYKQTRIGKNGKLFKMFKFRTMINNTEDIPSADLKDIHSKITISGNFFRKTSLDEIPQFFNIVKFDMKLIGYRPCLPIEDDVINARSKFNLLNKKPGITGWAQINGRDLVSVEEKAYLDSFYYENHSIYLDIKIIIFSIIKVLAKKDVSH